jgi:ankyrin repeat protein
MEILRTPEHDLAIRRLREKISLWTSLVRAIECGNTAEFKALVESHEVDPNLQDNQGRSLLHEAVRYRAEAIVRMLVENDEVDVNIRDRWGRTPLWQVVSLAHKAVFELLLDSDRVDPEAKDENGRTLLWKAASQGHAAVVELLLNNTWVDLEARDENGRTLLWEAASRGHKDVVEFLLDNDRADPEAKDKNGRTPLWEAASRGHKAVVEFLLGNDRVDPEIRDENGQTPLSAAALGQESVVELLLASGRVDPDTKDARGLTPLAWASRTNQSARIAGMLLSTGKVDASSKDKLGITPLMWSTTSHSDEVKELLLNSGKLDEDLAPTTAGDIDSRYIIHWIESCDSQHGRQCRPAPLEHKLPEQLPHWVIDISRGCLVPGNTVSRYIALSYVWSQGWGNNMMSRPSDSILLKKLNLSDFQTPGYLRETWTKLPNAVKEAVALVRKLGDNYLWVDCLCIVQDDEKTREQVDHMGDIYSGAHLTIISADPWGMLLRTVGVFRSSRMDDKVEDLYEDLYRSKWATRGWTFQEQMLSKRAIVFSQCHTFWECQQCAWSRDGPRPERTTSGSTSFTAPHYDKASSMLSSSYPDFDLYTELISLYNSRVFTYPQDVLPAFSGVLSTLGRNFPSGFLYGLPRIYLDTALLWQPFRSAHRRVARDDDQGTTTPKTHLPSWSWCGWTCPVDPYHLRTRSSYFNKNHRGSQLPVWKTQKLVQWYYLPEDMQCQVPADRPLIPEDGSSTLLSSPTPLSASPQYVSLPHDSWPFLSCQTSCLSLHIKAVCYSFPASQRRVRARRMAGWGSIFKLPLFAQGPRLQDACDLICLETQEGLSAGVLRHMEKAKLRIGDTVGLIAVSTGTINSTGVEGDEGDKLYKLDMEAYVDNDPVYARTSEYLGQYDSGGSMLSPEAWSLMRCRTNKILEVKKEMELYGIEGSDGREYHFYNVLWVERKGEIAYRRAAGRVPKAIWDANCTPPTKIILG